MKIFPSPQTARTTNVKHRAQISIFVENVVCSRETKACHILLGFIEILAQEVAYLDVSGI